MEQGTGGLLHRTGCRDESSGQCVQNGGTGPARGSGELPRGHSSASVRGSYRGYEILSICPPSSGGTVLDRYAQYPRGLSISRQDQPTGPSPPPSAGRSDEDEPSTTAPNTLEILTSTSCRCNCFFPRPTLTRWRQGIGEQATPAAEIGADILTVPEKRADNPFFGGRQCRGKHGQ